MKRLKILVAVADRLIPAGWKRTLGLLAIIAAMILERFELITENEEDSVILFGIGLVGVGIAAAKARKRKPTDPVAGPGSQV